MKTKQGVEFVSLQLNCIDKDKPNRWPESILFTENGSCIAGYLEGGFVVYFHSWEFMKHCIDDEGEPGINLDSDSYYATLPAVETINLGVTLDGPLW